METKVKILHIIQARIGSSRLLGKIMYEIGGKTLLQHHIERTQIKKIDSVLPVPLLQVIAMPKYDALDNRIQEMKENYKYDFRFPECQDWDVLSRFYMVAKEFHNPEWIVRTTADCPFIDREWFLNTIKIAVENDMPMFNTFKEGSCTEVFRFEHLQRAFYEATDPKDREHVTSYFRKGFAKESIDTFPEYIKAKELYEAS